jgi:IS30 family transposase
MTTFITFLLLPLLLVAGVALWLSESKEQKIRRWHKTGVSQREIARRLDVSRYFVSKALSAA